ncbi:hypothetical protein AQJ46_43105 [Streptomyces canus]|uniref:DUF2029 domain-containing protein n=2 Tax=Streptomyces TaxID=1883 RepID=A0A101RMT0_9ACTN|nr:hypothetical protein AQJ46_43105 [Streptomyces canus]
MWVSGWLVAAAWAGALSLSSTTPTHRAWGGMAGVGYLLAAAAACCTPRRHALRVSGLLALVGAVLLPLLFLVLTGQAQSEVTVIEHSADLLIHTGSPYLPHPRRVIDYNPYLPGMALLGLPRALLGDGNSVTALLDDGRIWCAAVFVSCLIAGQRVLRTSVVGVEGRWQPEATSPGTAMTILIASPFVALPLCVSGVDLPLIGACCLGLALAARGRPVAAGVVLAFACSLKWPAWPAVPVALTTLVSLYGGRAAARCAGVALAVTAALILPGVLRAPRTIAVQVLAFPTGRAKVATPAASPLPGRLLASVGPGGWAAAVALLALSAAVMVVSLVRRPPTDAVQSADRLAIGLTMAFALAPASRFGYFELPVVLSVWTRLACAPHTGAAPRHAPGAARGSHRESTDPPLARINCSLKEL